MKTAIKFQYEGESISFSAHEILDLVLEVSKVAYNGGESNDGPQSKRHIMSGPFSFYPCNAKKLPTTPLKWFEFAASLKQGVDKTTQEAQAKLFINARISNFFHTREFDITMEDPQGLS